MNPIKKPFSKLVLCFTLLVIASVKIAEAQSCSGAWINNHPFTYECISGQLIGTPFGPDPTGCPINPTYTAAQTNTFIFDNPINSFVVDFNAFSSSVVGCARMQVKINGVFYPLIAANLVELPIGTICIGSTNILTVTADGYIITNSNSPTNNGQGRLVFNAVNATSVTFSTNDNGGGTVFTSPCMPVVVPIKLKSFTGKEISGCKAKLNWETGAELNVKNIELLSSIDGNEFRKVSDILPKGSDSHYTIETGNYLDAYFRLKINDLVGSYEYSEIIYLKSSCNNNTYAVVPDPAVDYIKIFGLKNMDHVFVLDMLGKMVLLFEGSQNNKLNIQSLSRGMYIIKVFNAGACKATLKWIKN